MRVCIAGGGRAAWTVGRLAVRAGWRIAGVALRETSSSKVPDLLQAPRVSLERLPDCDLLFAAVSDDSLEEIGARLAVSAPPERHLLHLSGSRSSAVFGSHPRRASLHPLASLPSPGTEPALEGSLFVAEGHAETLAVLEDLAEAAGARLARIESAAKPLYHAAAVIGSNYIALLAELSRRLMTEAGIESLQQREIESLAATALSNWAARGTAGITGPVARGDAGTIAAHLDALASDPSLRDLYCAMGIELARTLASGGGEIAQYQEIAAMLERSRAR